MERGSHLGLVGCLYVWILEQFWRCLWTCTFWRCLTLKLLQSS